MRIAQGKLREGAVATGGEILRFAQDDSPDLSPVRFREAFSPNISAWEKEFYLSSPKHSFSDTGTLISQALALTRLLVLYSSQ
jgi:hypothetical protein